MATTWSVPKTYAGVLFRSTLEADWANTLDRYGIVWQYEPEAVRLPSGVLYRPDFYLPELTTWLEVKGPHDERIDKTHELAEASTHHPDHADECSCWLNPWRLTVVGRPATRGAMSWDSAMLSQDIHFARCSNCSAFNFREEVGNWTCRGCGAEGKVGRGLGLARSGVPAFYRL